MQARWFYRHGDHVFGPYPREQMQLMAALGLMHPDDVLWPEGCDESAGEPARAAIDFARVPKPRLSTPDWLADVERAERTGPQAIEWPAVAVPDWLRELREAPGLSVADATTGSAAESTVSRAPAKEESQPLESPEAPTESVDALYQRARAAIHAWAELDTSKSLILTGDFDAIRQEPAVQVILRLAEQCSPHLAARFWKHLEFVVYTRRKHYLAAP
jgi:hypothetical protein